MKRLFALMLLALAFIQIAPAHAIAQTDQLSQAEFDDLVDEIVETDQLFGPRSYELEHDPDAIAFRRLYTETADFLLTLTIGNPYDADDHPFDFAIRFRAHGDFLDPTFLQISVESDGVWWLEAGTQSEYRDADATLLDSGRYRDLETTAKGSNDVAIYAEGDTVAISINGEMISTVEAPFDDLGDIMICTGIYDSNWQEGAVTDLHEVTVWSLD